MEPVRELNDYDGSLAGSPQETPYHGAPRLPPNLAKYNLHTEKLAQGSRAKKRDRLQASVHAKAHRLAHRIA